MHQWVLLIYEDDYGAILAHVKIGFEPVFWPINIGFGIQVELHFVSNVYKLYQIILFN